MMIRKATCGLMMAAAFAFAGQSSANVLTNAGFETDDASGGDVGGATGWSNFEGGFTSAQSAPAFEGDNVFKVFGPFGGFGAAGAFQDFAVSAGQNVTGSVQAQNWSGDPLQGNNFGAINLEFFDAGGAQIGVVNGDQLGVGATQDVWTQLNVAGAAPVGAVTGRVVILHIQATDPVAGGSIFFDAADVEVPEPGSLALLGLGGLALLRRRR